MAAAAIVANNIQALNINANYFEANNRYNQLPATNFSFVNPATGLPVAVCADIVISGAGEWIAAALPHLLAKGLSGWRAAPIPLSNQ